VLYIFYHVLSTVQVATHMNLMHMKYLFTSKTQRYCVLSQFFYLTTEHPHEQIIFSFATLWIFAYYNLRRETSVVKMRCCWVINTTEKFSYKCVLYIIFKMKLLGKS